MQMLIIVAGEECPIDTTSNTVLSEVVDAALAYSRNTGRPKCDWELRTAEGTLLDLGKKAFQYGFYHGIHLYLSPRIGAGGECAQ